MPLQSPAFWNTSGFAAKLLLPAAAIYQLGYRLRRHFTIPAKITPKLLCIGNLVAGGAGKTPVALEIGHYLNEQGIHACFLSKGYGSNLTFPVQVDISKHNAAEVGDEPLLLARVLPTIVAKNRIDGAFFAQKCGFDLIVMDDGFQNPTLRPDFSLLVADAAYGFGNGYTLPAGPLREPVAYGLARADALIMLRRAPSQPHIPDYPIPVLVGNLHTHCPWDTTHQKLVAFSGIARPQQFFDALEHQCGAQLIARHTFADHHPFNARELEQLRNEAKKHHARLVTTAKDAVRLPPEMRDEVLIAEARINWHNAGALAETLSPLLLRKED